MEPTSEQASATRSPEDGATSHIAPNELCPRVNDHGITVLYTPKSGECVADLIFVHGLGGHPLKTWLHGKVPKTAPPPKPRQRLRRFVSSLSRKSRSASPAGATRSASPSRSTLQIDNLTVDDSPSCCYWPFDLVKEAFPTVRIMTYGYDSNPSHFYQGRSVQMNISQHADQLHQAVSDQRVGCRGRPVIFVAHSLGGILVKDALVQAAKYEHQPDLLDLGKSCSAIIFFGTPHRGANIAAYGEMVANIVSSLPFAPSVYKEVLRGLKPDGEKISNVEKDFNDILNQNIPASEKIQIYSFREGKGLTSLKTLDGKVVPDSSSHFSRRDIEQTSFVMANHMDMCRFTSDGQPSFPAFKAALSGYLHRIREPRIAEQTQKATIRAAMSESLDFDERYQRQHDLASLQTFDETFAWVWRSVFADWLKTPEPLFWIRGKPASGKSTLVNYLTAAPETKEIAQKSLGSKFQLIYHFSDFRAGDGIGNNFEGLLLSLLAQLVSNLPQSSPGISKLDGYLQKNQNPNAELKDVPIGLLRGCLLEILKGTTNGILIFLDGLDEYSGNRAEFTMFIKSLCGPKIKICLASRADPPFPDAFKTIPCFEMHMVNRPGISAYAIHSLREIVFDCEGYSKAELEETANFIVQESEGVFLWARFAILELISAVSEGYSMDAKHMQATLGKIPRELGDIYSQIFQRLPEGDRRICALVLLLTTAAEDIVPLAMLQLTMTKLLPDSSGFGNLELPATADHIVRFGKRIVGVTRGLAELRRLGKRRRTLMRPNGSKPSDQLTVRLLHRTVVTYLDNAGWKELLGDQPCAGLGDELWLRASITGVYMQRDYLREIMHKNDFDTRCLEYPPYGNDGELSGAGHLMLAYAATYMPQHAFNLESRSGASSFPILNGDVFAQIACIHMSIFHHTCRCQNGRFGAMQRPAKRAGGDVTETLLVATGHLLHLFVRDFLDIYKDRKVGELDCTANTVVIRAESSHVFNTTKHLTLGNMMSTTTTESKLIKDIVLQYAANFAEVMPEPMFLVIFQAALDVDAIVPDYIVFQALKKFPVEVVELVLERRRADTPLLLKTSRWNLHDYARHIDLLADREEEREYGLLWPLGQRSYLLSNTGRLVDLLLAKGEDINAPCGPFGTILHSLVDNLPDDNREFDSLLSLFIEKGADINTCGSHGNILEFGWLIANRFVSSQSKKWVRYSNMIKTLIAAGAVNNRQDPNGIIPSREFMLCWASDHMGWQDFERFYWKGGDSPCTDVAPSQ